jgi:hypothetical protein
LRSHFISQEENKHDQLSQQPIRRKNENKILLSRRITV